MLRDPRTLMTGFGEDMVGEWLIAVETTLNGLSLAPEEYISPARVG